MKTTIHATIASKLAFGSHDKLTLKTKNLLKFSYKCISIKKNLLCLLITIGILRRFIKKKAKI